MKNIEELSAAIAAFVAARDWAQFHTPKNLSVAVAVEAAELMEEFLWLTAEQSRNLTRRHRDAVAREMADVLIYLLRLSQVLDVDLVAAAERKLRANARKYPASRVRGTARKPAKKGGGALKARPRLSSW